MKPAHYFSDDQKEIGDVWARPSLQLKKLMFVFPFNTDQLRTLHFAFISACLFLSSLISSHFF